MSARIVTLTLNPAVDLACEAAAVVPTRKIRMTGEIYDAGGGGINVARVVHELGGEALAVLMAGGATGNFLEELLDEAGVERRIIPVRGRTRISVTVHDHSSQLEYRFVPEGPLISEAEWRSVLSALEEIEAGWLVASGSLPRGVPQDFYARLARLAARRGQRLVLDTSGAALKAALGQGLTLVKPSLGELEELLGRPVREPKDQEEQALALAQSGAAQMVVVSLGAEGAVLATARKVMRLAAPAVAVRSAVGAGDGFVAGMTLGLARGLEPQAAFVWGIATGTSAVMSYGTAHLHRVDVEALHARLRST
jgi:6-phosphofructokinase 2